MRWFPGRISGNHVGVLIVHLHDLHAHWQTHHHHCYHNQLLMFRVYCLCAVVFESYLWFLCVVEVECAWCVKCLEWRRDLSWSRFTSHHDLLLRAAYLREYVTDKGFLLKTQQRLPPGSFLRNILWCFDLFEGHRHFFIFLWAHSYTFFELPVMSHDFQRHGGFHRSRALSPSCNGFLRLISQCYTCRSLKTLRCICIDVTTRLTLRSIHIYQQQERNDEKQINREIESFRSLGNCWRKLCFFSDGHAHWTEKLKKHQQLP